MSSPIQRIRSFRNETEISYEGPNAAAALNLVMQQLQSLPSIRDLPQAMAIPDLEPMQAISQLVPAPEMALPRVEQKKEAQLPSPQAVPNPIRQRNGVPQ